jgi:hypothetical protein
MIFLTSSTAVRKISHAPSISWSETTARARAMLIPQTDSRSIWTATSLSSKASSVLEAESRELPSPRQEQLSIAFSGCAASRVRAACRGRKQRLQVLQPAVGAVAHIRSFIGGAPRLAKIRNICEPSSACVRCRTDVPLQTIHGARLWEVEAIKDPVARSNR